MSPYSASARFSDCRKYRYTLERVWRPDLPMVCFLMLNPSTACAFRLDRTVAKCIKFAGREKFGGIRVVNLFALRSTNPSEMMAHASPIEDPDAEDGPLYAVNDGWIINQSDGLRLIVAWGCDGTFMGRDQQVLDLFGKRKLECFGVTKDGHPKHPLYLADDTPLVPFLNPLNTQAPADAGKTGAV
jgi:hypothetical protein